MKFNSWDIGRTEVACPYCTRGGCTDQLAGGWLFGLLHVCDVIALRFFSRASLHPERLHWFSHISHPSFLLIPC